MLANHYLLHYNGGVVNFCIHTELVYLTRTFIHRKRGENHEYERRKNI